MFRKMPVVSAAVGAAAFLLSSTAALADGNFKKVNHIIIVMQENHSFDNYFGALAYAPGSPYHNGNGACASTDHKCVDGLTCTVTNGMFSCTNSNLDDDGSIVVAFKATSRCVRPDLDHSWVGTHHEINFSSPNNTLKSSLSNGFVRQNDLTEQVDNGTETATDDETISFYNQDDLPFYDGLAQKFAISDRQFSSVLGPTFPNRSYLMAATSFGHLTTDDSVPPVVGYKPITGTIFDQLNNHGIMWADCFEDVPLDGSFRRNLCRVRSVGRARADDRGVSVLEAVLCLAYHRGSHLVVEADRKTLMPGVHLTKRDQYANDLESMFDFDHSPSLNTPVGSAQPPQNDCTP
jgi:phospholipase C